MVLVEESYGKDGGEWAGKAEKQWKQRIRIIMIIFLECLSIQYA